MFDRLFGCGRIESQSTNDERHHRPAITLERTGIGRGGRLAVRRDHRQRAIVGRLGKTAYRRLGQGRGGEFWRRCCRTIVTRHGDHGRALDWRRIGIGEGVGAGITEHAEAIEREGLHAGLTICARHMRGGSQRLVLGKIDTDGWRAGIGVAGQVQEGKDGDGENGQGRNRRDIGLSEGLDDPSGPYARQFAQMPTGTTRRIETRTAWQV